MKTSLDHCVIHVSDWERSGAFYERVCGAEIVPDKVGFSLRFGEQQLNCHGPGKAAEPLARLPVMPGGSDICFRWHGTIDDAVAHLAEQNVPVEMGPFFRQGAFGRGLSVYFRNPDGTLLEFISYDV